MAGNQGVIVMSLLKRIAPWPLHFDGNEWAALAFSLGLLFIVLKLPKRMTRISFLMIFVFNEFLVTSVDDILALKPYDYYDWMDQDKFELFDIFLYYMLYPLFGYLFLYLHDRWKAAGARLLFYIAGWTAFSTLFEWVVIKVHILTYKHWKLALSVPVYVTVFLMNLVLYRYILPHLKKTPSG